MLFLTLQAEVLIAYENPGYGEVPYTLQYGQCGEKGTYIHLTPNYMLDDTYVTNYGPRGRMLLERSEKSILLKKNCRFPEVDCANI